VGLWELAFAAGVVVNPVANCCVWDVVFEGAAGFAACYGREGDLLDNLGCVLRSCRGLLNYVILFSYRLQNHTATRHQRASYVIGRAKAHTSLHNMRSPTAWVAVPYPVLDPVFARAIYH
jgi:hypothetical protein